MELNVGDYVRTKYGIIAKITDIIKDLSIDCDRDVYYENSLKDNMPMMEIPYNLKEEYIIKSSPNIIDLIEVSDYVNGNRVDAIGSKYVIFYDGDGDIEIFEDDIKSILTHEQFEAIEYKVGDN